KRSTRGIEVGAQKVRTKSADTNDRSTEAVQRASNRSYEADAMKRHHHRCDLVQGSSTFGHLDSQVPVRADGHSTSNEVTFTLREIHCLEEMQARLDQIAFDAAYACVELVSNQYAARRARPWRPPADPKDMLAEITKDLVAEMAPDRCIHLKRPGEPPLSRFASRVFTAQALDVRTCHEPSPWRVMPTAIRPIPAHESSQVRCAQSARS